MSHTFHPVSWSINVSIYEVNLRQYTQEGSFDAFRPHLKRLAEMGIDVLWFMPITPISHKNRKGSLGSYYASSSYRTINPEFGSLEEWKTIVSEAHAMGMKVIMDWVANHTGCDHEWTQSHPDFYKRDHNGQFYDSHGWDDVIDLNYENPEMRQEMISCMQQWLVETDIDGFRCDMAMLTPVDFWEQARTALEKSKPLFWLAELDPLDHPEYMRVFDAAYTWRWMNEASRFMNEGSHHVHALRQVLDLYMHSLPSTACPAWFTSNHDENSWNGTEYEKYGPMALPLAVFSATWKGLTLIYSGQEIPNQKRLLFFDKDPLEWKDDPELHEFYKKILKLRKRNSALCCLSDQGNCHHIWNSVDHHVFSFVRSSNEDKLFVLINFSIWDLPEIEIDTMDLEGEYIELFSEDNVLMDGDRKLFSLPAWGYKIYIKKKADHG
jgi:alpha-amylase